jgi:hypothetical protein
MLYYVITDDGNRYGPADVETLSGWIAEGRLLPTTLLEEEGSGARIAASAVPGLNFPPPPMAAPGAPPSAGASSNPYSAPGGAAPGSSPYSAPPGAQYQRPGIPYGGDNGQGDVTISWIAAVASLVLACCCGLGLVSGVVGIIFANRAKAKGNPGAAAPQVFSIVMTVICSLIFIFQLIRGPAAWAQYSSVRAGTYQPAPNSVTR